MRFRSINSVAGAGLVALLVLAEGLAVGGEAFPQHRTLAQLQYTYVSIIILYAMRDARLSVQLGLFRTCASILSTYSRPTINVSHHACMRGTAET